MIFSGGTCLSKAYQNNQRMSEDIDIKFIENKPDRKKLHRKNFNKLVLGELEKIETFNVVENPNINDVYRTQIFEIQYPKAFEHSAIKPNLKLELVECKVYQPKLNQVGMMP